MLDIFRSIINQSNPSLPASRSKKYKVAEEEVKKDELSAKPEKKTRGLLWFVPPAPFQSFPQMPLIRYDDMHADLTEITSADKLCFTGLQIQSMSIIDNRFMFAHNITAGKKEEKHGHEEKSGWTFQAGLAPTTSGTFSITGRYNSEVTTVGTTFDSWVGSFNINVNFSELPEKKPLGSDLARGFC